MNSTNFEQILIQSLWSYILYLLGGSPRVTVSDSATDKHKTKQMNFNINEEVAIENKR